MIAQLSGGAILGPGAACIGAAILLVVGRRTDTQARRDRAYARRNRIGLP